MLFPLLVPRRGLRRGPMVDFREPLEVPVPQWNSDEHLPPLAMLAAISRWTKRGSKRPISEDESAR